MVNYEDERKMPKFDELSEGDIGAFMGRLGIPGRAIDLVTDDDKAMGILEEVYNAAREGDNDGMNVAGGRLRNRLETLAGLDEGVGSGDNRYR